MTIDNRYAVGAFCTWHDFLSHAHVRAHLKVNEHHWEPSGWYREQAGTDICSVSFGIDEAPCYLCPRCGCEVTEVSLEDWLASVAAAQRREPGAEHEAMALWSRGRCFPDFDTVINAYRQAMEE